MSNLKKKNKIINNDKRVSDKTETKQQNLHFTRKVMEIWTNPLLVSATITQKKTKKSAKFISSLIFCKNNYFRSKENHQISIEVIQIIYAQRRLYMRRLGPVIIEICMRLQKEQQRETTNKNSIKTCEKTLSKP